MAWSTWNLNNAFTGRTDSSHEHCFYLQGDFFNWASPENVSRLAPPKNALTATFDSEYQLKINFTGT